MSDILVFTDGASRGNPGPAGWGAVIALEKKVQELGGAIDEGTNNEAELKAVVAVLKWLKDEAGEEATINIYSDSTYTISGATKWIFGWKSRGWTTKTGDPVKNKALWQQFDNLQSFYGNKIDFHKVKGHASIPANERADDIATAFADGDDPDLYSGTKGGYGVSLDPRPQYLENSPVYFSLVDGVACQHNDWAECKDRVAGVSAKYKKVRTITERDKLLEEWGVPLEEVRE